jgi:hypothetical protein
VERQLVSHGKHARLRVSACYPALSLPVAALRTNEYTSAEVCREWFVILR